MNQVLSPTFFSFGPFDRVPQALAAVHLDGALVGPVDLLGPGVNTRPAKPGDIILLFGTGFGQTSPPVPVGTLPGQVLALGVTSPTRRQNLLRRCRGRAQLRGPFEPCGPLPDQCHRPRRAARRRARGSQSRQPAITRRHLDQRRGAVGRTRERLRGIGVPAGVLNGLATCRP